MTSDVNNWATAWRAKDANAHLKFYADKFIPEAPLDKAVWLKQRKETLATSSKVELKLDALRVTCDGNKASAKFKQDFKLTGYQTKKVGEQYQLWRL